MSSEASCPKLLGWCMEGFGPPPLEKGELEGDFLLTRKRQQPENPPSVPPFSKGGSRIRFARDWFENRQQTPWSRFGRATALLLLLTVHIGCAHEVGRPEPGSPAAGVTARVEVARSNQGMVVAGHPEAADAGLRILKAGGNAIDASVAVSLALGVAEPYGSGLGGKLMMLYRDQASHRTFAVDAMDEASSTLDVARFAARPYEERAEGWSAVAIPGLLAGMYEAHRQWGRLSWDEVVQPAIDLARSGTLILPQTRSFFGRRIDRIRVSDEAARIYLPGGKLPAPGSRLANHDLARTLEAIARHGRDGFYRGPVAEAIADASREGGGSLTLSDLASYKARFTEPLHDEFAGVEIATAPPPASGGATLLAVLARLRASDWQIAEGHETRVRNPLEPEHLDRIGTILQRTYPEIQARIADVPTADDAFYELLRIGRADSPPRPSSSSEPLAAGGSTTHFVVADSDGNVASVTQSLSHHFGAGVVAPGTGVLFNNSLKNFATQDTGSVNFVAPGKRPRSTIAPTLAFRDGEPILALGVPGGQRIPTATLQVLLDVLAFGTDLADAIARPRVHLKRPLRDTEPTNVFELEVKDRRLARALRKQGWATRVSADNETFGGFCAIEILPDGTFVGVADLRRTNAARGY